MLRNRVRTSTGEEIGKIEDIIIDPTTERVLYAVLLVEGYPELFIVPWSLLGASRSTDSMVLNTDLRTLERGPAFNPADWPDITEPAWEQRIHDHYRTTPAAVRDRPVRERVVRVEPDVATRRDVVVPRREVSFLGGALAAMLLLGLLVLAFLISTRGWDGARNTVSSYFSGAAYAMKEGSQDATLTAKVKTALALNKDVPAGKINVDTENDIVTLRGEVQNDQIRTLAEKIARDTPGVREVRNHLYATQHTQ
jgi:hypothetical protein